ncbi:hypothetical protein NDU88_004310 [Pleurodeles waltl]|uniref:Uncharacterized protein n=1 Tax=Pleurodeles waltl TaxID=8319 RepID=A0AAV7T979_PLEWA|nr:hypothetical protein NDU88_004310 [Pleurodeles waltl]
MKLEELHKEDAPRRPVRRIASENESVLKHTDTFSEKTCLSQEIQNARYPMMKEWVNSGSTKKMSAMSEIRRGDLEMDEVQSKVLQDEITGRVRHKKLKQEKTLMKVDVNDEVVY